MYIAYEEWSIGRRRNTEKSVTSLRQRPYEPIIAAARCFVNCAGVPWMGGRTAARELFAQNRRNPLTICLWVCENVYRRRRSLRRSNGWHTTAFSQSKQKMGEEMELSKKGTVLSNGASIYYEVYGEGRPLIFLHGNGENMKYFRNNARYFARRYQSIFIDTRAHGKSSRGIGWMDMETLAGDVLEVMAQLRLAKASVIGFSDGGNIALTMALMAEEKIDRLVLCGANLSPGGLTTGAALMVFGMYVKALAAMTMDHSKVTQAEIVNLMVSYPDIPPEALNELRIPVLVLAGEHDMIKRRHTQEIYDNIARGQLKIIAGGDHFILRDKAEECNEVIRQFLEKKY